MRTTSGGSAPPYAGAVAGITLGFVVGLVLALLLGLSEGLLMAGGLVVGALAGRSLERGSRRPPA